MVWVIGCDGGVLLAQAELIRVRRKIPQIMSFLEEMIDGNLGRPIGTPLRLGGFLLTWGCSVPFIFKDIFEILGCLRVFDGNAVFRETTAFTIGTVMEILTANHEYLVINQNRFGMNRPIKITDF